MKTLFVLYYHRVLPFRGYDVHIDVFEKEIKLLSENFDIVDLSCVYDVLNGSVLKKNSVLITFDDGYFDNFVYAYPILKKYKIRAVLFLATSKIWEGLKRKTMEDYWNNRVLFTDLMFPARNENALSNSLNNDFNEFLNWDEVEDMHRSGVFEIASHGHLHTKVFSSSRIIDIKNSNTHWSFIYATGGDRRSDIPVYNMKSLLYGKRYFDDVRLRDASIKLSRKGYTKDRIIRMLNQHKKTDYFENANDARNRIEGELKISKDIIEKHIGTDIYTLSWPWGEFSSLSIKAGKNVGFKMAFSTKRGIVLRHSNPYILPRIKASTNLNHFRKRLFIYSKHFLSKFYTLLHP